MPSTLHTPLLLLGLLWTIFLGRFAVSAYRGKLSTPFAQLLWIAGFFGVLLVSLSGQDVEHSLDASFGSVPITFYTKFVCALLVIHTLYWMLRPTARLPAGKDRILRSSCLVMILLGLLTLPLFMKLPPIQQAQLRYGLLAARDLLVCGYMLSVFIPTTFRLWKKEAILPMKLKHFAGVIFDVAYLLLATGNVLTFIASFPSLETATFIDRSFRYVMWLCALCFIITVSPHRLLAVMLWPQRWFLLRRLRRLEMQIARCVGFSVSHPRGMVLEDRIYRTVIFILDQYRHLNDQADLGLYQRIDTIVSTTLDYSRLAEELAKLV